MENERREPTRKALTPGKRRVLIPAAVLLALLTLTCIVCLLCATGQGGILDSQQAALRWQGDSELNFAQLSCFMPEEGGVTQSQINTFRTAMVTRMQEAALGEEIDLTTIFTDAWSTQTTAEVFSERSSGDVTVNAVGGNFFLFHPLQLVSGSYLSTGDGNSDSILVDESLAWLLFGGTELTGKMIYVNGTACFIAGVVRTEQDAFSQKAQGDGMHLWMSWELYTRLFVTEGEASATCYELVMPNPMKKFAYSFVKSTFPAERFDLMENSSRFTLAELYPAMKTQKNGLMHVSAIAYPAWENAAILYWARAANFLRAAICTGILPALALLAALIWIAVRAWRWLSETAFPAAAGSAAERFRVWGRRRVEREERRRKETL